MFLSEMISGSVLDICLLTVAAVCDAVLTGRTTLMRLVFVWRLKWWKLSLLLLTQMQSTLTLQKS